ncbi:IS66 family insertion sequence element accessory protein TnpA [Janthinobacterium lividum]
MSNEERQKVWQERAAQWQASGLSQKAFATEQGLVLCQVVTGYAG